VKYTDEWCDTTVSAAAITAGVSRDVFPRECGCERHIKLFQGIGAWQENDAYIPTAGDVIFYDWKDSGSGDDTGAAQHVGVVESCDGKNITVIEGNKGQAVARRTIAVNGKYIRGFAVPKYPTSTTTTTPSTTTDAGQTIWNYFIGKGCTTYGVAGLMGNLRAESALQSTNLQNSYNTKLGLTDAQYTAKVDDGSYTNFVRDSAGYGLAQWTYWSRKQNMYNQIKAAGKSIGDLGAQLDFLHWELSTGYKSVWTTLQTAKTVLEASNAVLLQFERPADQSAAMQATRAKYGQEYYDKYAGATPAPAPTPTPSGTLPTNIVLKKGSTGDNVKLLQTALNKLISAALTVDGSFGPATDAAVRNFQKQHSLAVDGSVGPATIAKINSLLTSAGYQVKINTASLNIRAGGSTTALITGSLKSGAIVSIVDEKDGWGKLEDGRGWISLKYTVKV